MKIQATGKTEYFVQNLNSADTMIRERITHKFHLLDCKQKVGIVDDLKEPQLNARRSLPTGWRKALSSPTRMTRDKDVKVQPRTVVSRAIPTACAKTPSPYQWGFQQLQSAQ